MSGRAIEMRKGDTLDVIDLEGQQVGDVWVVDAANHRKWLSTSHTRDALERLFPRVGEFFFDQTYDPIMQFVADTSPGLHDMLFPACNPALYMRAGLNGDHPNCADNFRKASRIHGIALATLPDPINVFQNSVLAGQGEIVVESAVSAPGDKVSMKAARDVIVVVTSCSVDFWPTNGSRCSSLLLEVLGPPETSMQT